MVGYLEQGQINYGVMGVIALTDLLIFLTNIFNIRF